MNIWIILTAAAVILLLIFGIYFYYEDRHFVVTSYTISSSMVPDDKKVRKAVLLADLHNHVYGKENEELFAAIRAQNPDVILIAGDMTVAHQGLTLKEAQKVLCKLAAEYPVYFANGNHEQKFELYPEKYGNYYGEFCKNIEKAGVHHLVNKQEYTDIKGFPICIGGLEIERKFFGRMKKHEMDGAYIEEKIGKKKKEIYHILLAHNPVFFKAYREWGADLTLSGHLHGGIVSLPFLGGVVSPQLIPFPKYDAGMFEEEGRNMVVSRGLGTHTLPVRLFNHAELIVLYFEPASATHDEKREELRSHAL